MAWLSAIAKSLFSSILESIVAYFEKEKAEAAKWEAKAREKQLESIKAGQAIEKQISNSVDAVSKQEKSISAWNAGLLLCVGIFLPGCMRFYVNAPSYRPVPPPIVRPQIPLDINGDGIEDELSEREVILMDYALKLETGYNIIRDEAKKHNENAGFPISE